MGVAIMAIEEFLAGRRVLYGAPTIEQVDRFWYEVSTALSEGIDGGYLKKNETEHFIEKPNSEQRIKAKTCWNSNTLRGDYADLLILDEWQLMAEDTWDEVGAPMLLDNNGDAIFIYTPPSLRASGVSRARDPRHAAKMFIRAQEDTTGRWEAFHFTSHDNPHISEEALDEITSDMSREAYLKEILAEDDDAQLSLLVYGAFNEKTCIIEPFPIPDNWLIYSMHDFGSANPAALFVAQSPMGELFVYHEYRPITGKSTAENVVAFKEITAGYNVIRRVGGSHQEEEIRQGYALAGWPISEPGQTKVAAQLDRVKQLMEKNRINVFNTCRRYLDEIRNCMWKLDDEGQRTDVIRDEVKYHLCAAARYGFSEFRPETVPTGKREIRVIHPQGRPREASGVLRMRR